MSLSLAPTPYRTKQAMVYESLRNAILEGELGAGSRLIINDLADQLQVSPSPVREAIQQMQAEGLVTLIPHVGAVVSSVSSSQVHEVFVLLEGLETVGNRIAAERMTPDDEASLRAILAALGEAIAEGDTWRWAALNREFHMRVCHITGMTTLTEFTGKVFDRWQRIRHTFFPAVPATHLRDTQAEHEAIVDAMVARDYPRLETLTREHNQKALARYSEALEAESRTR